MLGRPIIAQCWYCEVFIDRKVNVRGDIRSSPTDSLIEKGSTPEHNTV